MGRQRGTHQTLVKAFDLDGNCATATATWKIAAQNEDVLAHFNGVKQNAQVQGVFPIQIAIDSSVHNPYVTFKVDNDFLAFMNYAPYTYNWDTTKADNGAHTIGVEVLDGDSLKTVQTLSLCLNVNNPGGYTKIHAEKAPAPAPLKPSTPANDIANIARSAAQAGQPSVPRGTGCAHRAFASWHDVLRARATARSRAQIQRGGHYPQHGAPRSAESGRARYRCGQSAPERAPRAERRFAPRCRAEKFTAGRADRRPDHR